MELIVDVARDSSSLNDTTRAVISFNIALGQIFAVQINQPTSGEFDCFAARTFNQPLTACWSAATVTTVGIA